MYSKESAHNEKGFPLITKTIKGTAKEVIFEDLDSTLCCPICGIDLLEFERHEESYEAKYCPECGQKLKWK